MDIVEQSAKRKLICPRRRNCRHASCRMSLRTNFGVVMGGEMVRRRRRSQKEYKHTAAYRESNRRPFPLYSTDLFRSKAPGFAFKSYFCDYNPATSGSTPSDFFQNSAF
jgi:hypothetical protein